MNDYYYNYYLQGSEDKTTQNDRSLNQSQIPHTSTSIEMSNNSLLEETQAKANER